MLITKTSPMALQTVNGTGRFTGIAAPFKEIDSYDDVVVPGAFRKTIDRNNGTVNLLWQHRQEIPIGIANINESSTALLSTNEINLGTNDGKNAHANITFYQQKKKPMGLSIGFMLPENGYEMGTMNGQRVRFLKEIDLVELSVVTTPAFNNARITDAKRQATAVQPSQEELTRLIRAIDVQTQQIRAALNDMKSPVSTAKYYWREISRFEIPEAKQRAAERVLAWACADLGVQAEMRWVKKETRERALPDLNKKTWCGDRGGPCYSSEEDFTARAYCSEGFFLLRHDLSEAEQAQSILHEMKHLKDAAPYGGILPKSVLPTFEQQAIEYEREAYARFAYRYC